MVPCSGSTERIGRDAEALTRCRGPEEIWMARDLKKAMVLIGGLNEATAESILDQEGV